MSWKYEGYREFYEGRKTKSSQLKWEDKVIKTNFRKNGEIETDHIRKTVRVSFQT